MTASEALAELEMVRDALRDDRDRLRRKLAAMTAAKNKALEALKEINDPNMPSHEWKHWLAVLPVLIAELEEVK